MQHQVFPEKSPSYFELLTAPIETFYIGNIISGRTFWSLVFQITFANSLKSTHEIPLTSIECWKFQTSESRLCFTWLDTTRVSLRLFSILVNRRKETIVSFIVLVGLSTCWRQRWLGVKYVRVLKCNLCVFQQESVKTAQGTVRRSDSWSFVRCPSLRAAAVIPAETPEAGT